MSSPTASTNPPPRRFAPEPIETTTKSSKQTRKHSPEKEDASKVRRFIPEAIDSSSKSSRKDAAVSGSKPITRRFAPEPVETSTKSSRKEPADGKPATRRFAPQPVETSHKSSRNNSKDNTGSSRFKPQLVETVFGGNRKSASRKNTQDDSTTNGDETTPKRFTPVVLSTASRSRRVGEADKTNRQDYRTEDGHQIHAREHRKHAGWKTPVEAKAGPGGSDPTSQLQRFDFSGKLREQIAPSEGGSGSRTPERTHSFRLPDLETIESSESDRGESEHGSDSSFHDFYRNADATRQRDSVDFGSYYFQLEAKKAQQRLQEQALAAFPNSDFHEPVQHYVNDDMETDEIEDRPVPWMDYDEEVFFKRARRESSVKISWEQMEMQRHAEQLERDRKADQTTAASKAPPDNSPWWNPDAGMTIQQPDADMQSMRDRARPPMLGNDLVFPRCPSPEPARFDVTQGSAKLRQQMLAESNKPQAPKEDKGGLWNAPAGKTSNISVTSASSKANSSNKGGGLWGGFCVATPAAPSTNPGGLAVPNIPTGLMTPLPRAEPSSNPFEQSFAARNGAPGVVQPPTPPPEGLTGGDLANLDAVLDSARDLDEMIEREYPDQFVTQVYNYLSLGYPTLARPFDEELSKISGIPIAELRQDDVKAKQNPRGHIRLDPAYEGQGGDGIEGNGCARWRALKLYVREWARQEKKGYADQPVSTWGAARRGSWAF
ncbi:unnamed protein product [Zymoseptoria tritici ST99CH_3D1]|nr:unnamed protein product [Zymoseptoria tritici ST99CH_3D1]